MREIKVTPRRNLSSRSKFHYTRYSIKNNNVLNVPAIIAGLSILISLSLLGFGNEEPDIANKDKYTPIASISGDVYTGDSIKETYHTLVVSKSETKDEPVMNITGIKMVKEDVSPSSIIMGHLEDDILHINNTTLRKLDLPSDYYGDIDFQFQPCEPYRLITDKSSPAYALVHGEDAYTDENGFRRYKVREDQFSIDGADDYMVALGTFYKEKGTVGSRYIVVTTMGIFTIIAADEKADKDTDPLNMYSTHGNGTTHAMLEWIVDDSKICKSIKGSGTASNGPVRGMQGKIIRFYEIKE